jgi:hypothetical protein
MIAHGPGLASAAEVGSVERLVEMLSAKGIITAAEADDFKKQYGTPTVNEAAGGLKDAQVDGLVIDGILDKLKEIDRTKTKHWTNRLIFSGDMRLRYQADYFDKGNHQGFVDPNDLSATIPQETRHRGRFRVRLAAEGKVNDQFTSMVKISTGNETDPVSTNDTLGDYQNKDSVVFDQAYIRWMPDYFPLSVWGGRIQNPWLSTDLVWDTDLNFEGVAGTYSPQITQNLDGFLTLGAFQIDEFARTQKDKYLLGAQLGLASKLGNGLLGKIAAAYYDYKNVTGEGVAANCQSQTCESEPQFMQKGNTLFYLDPANTTVGLAANFKELNITGELDVSVFNPVHVILTGDYVKNIGYDSEDVARRVYGSTVNSAASDKQDQGYQFGLSVGYPQVRDSGQWKTYLFYKHLEADAVLDAFTDSDFHLGGTHCKGWILGGELGLGKNTWLTGRWLTSDAISGPQFSVDTLQIDLNVKY